MRTVFSSPEVGQCNSSLCSRIRLSLQFSWSLNLWAAQCWIHTVLSVTPLRFYEEQRTKCIHSQRYLTMSPTELSASTRSNYVKITVGSGSQGRKKEVFSTRLIFFLYCNYLKLIWGLRHYKSFSQNELMNMAQIKNSKICHWDLICGFIYPLYMEGVYAYIYIHFGAI